MEPKNKGEDNKSELSKQRISIEQYNLEVDEAVRRYENGIYIAHSDAKQEMERWFHG